ncbi:DUF7286 family protein [Halogranum amylolyticum]
MARHGPRRVPALHGPSVQWPLRRERATLQYVRDGSPVALDVDGDGETERLGRSERLSFETTAVAVTAIPGGQWIGDVDGNVDERSAGWADGPGCVGDAASAPPTTPTTSAPAAANDCRAD